MVASCGYSHGFDRDPDARTHERAGTAMTAHGTDAVLVAAVEGGRLGLSCIGVQAVMLQTHVELGVANAYAWGRTGHQFARGHCTHLAGP